MQVCDKVCDLRNTVCTVCIQSDASSPLFLFTVYINYRSQFFLFTTRSFSHSVFSWIIHQCHHVDLFLVSGVALCVCVSAAAVCVCVCVRAKQRSPHPVLGCNLCHWLEFDGWAAPHNTVSQGWSGGVCLRTHASVNVYALGCVRIIAPPLHDFVCLHPEMRPWEPARVCARCAYACVYLRALTAVQPFPCVGCIGTVSQWGARRRQPRPRRWGAHSCHLSH